MNVPAMLEGKRIAICGGSGGVGKTTTAAAIAMGMALDGARVAVVTIDPAQRLANSLGLEELGNEPRRVDARRFARAGLEMKGELWAMMLDPKRTFDELIGRLAPNDSARDEVLENRIYKELSSAVAGSQEFTAIAKLYELDREGDYDLLVLDTPPSRNALDFLDAPDRLTSFFEGRALQVFLRPDGPRDEALRPRDRRGLLGPQARHRHRPPPGPLGLLPLAGRDDRRLQGARERRQRAARGSGHDLSPRSHRPSASRSRRRRSSGASSRRRACRSAA